MFAPERLPRYLCGGALLLACALLAEPWLQARQWPLAGLAGACALLWLLGLRQNRPGLATPCFLGLCLVNVIGVIVNATAVLGVLCQTLLLGCWDLNYLSAKAERLASATDRDAYVTRHLLRLGAVLAIGCALGLLFLQVRFALPFAPTLLVGLACILLLYWFVSGLKKLSRGP